VEYLTEIKVRGYHADFYGHVNNARFLEFLEEDRWAHLTSKMDLEKLASKGLFFLVVNININYRKAVPVGAILLVSTTLEKIGNRSAVLKQEIVFKESGETAADALVTFVLGDSRGKAVMMTGDLLEEVRTLNRSEEFAVV
jgi:thioesterase III